MDAKNEKRRLRILSDPGGDAGGRAALSGRESGEKRLLPEVLPDPTARAGTGSARQRALDRMTRLVAYAAASAALQAGCNESATSSGYGVVDPMPPPSRCEGVAASIKATATWRKGDGGFYIEIVLAKPARADAHYSTTEKPYTSQGTITGVDLKDGALTTGIVPQGSPGAYSWLSVAVECAAGPAHIMVDITVPEAAPAEGAAIPITVRDQF